MPTNEETINIDTDSKINRIQITINLGQPVTESVIASTDPGTSANVPPAGTLVRQVMPDPNDNTNQIVRITFLPDDSEEGATTDIQNPDIGNKAKWTEFLGSQNVDVDIDTGITLVRFNTTGDVSGVATWLPDDPNGTPLMHVFQEAPHEHGGASIGDFFGCWRDEGWNASGMVTCAGELNVI